MVLHGEMNDKNEGCHNTTASQKVNLAYEAPVQKLAFSLGNDSIENHRAHGGHIWVNSHANKAYTGGRYIIPLCPECNGQHGKEIIILKGSVYCKELGATII